MNMLSIVLTLQTNLDLNPTFISENKSTCLAINTKHHFQFKK